MQADFDFDFEFLETIWSKMEQNHESFAEISPCPTPKPMQIAFGFFSPPRKLHLDTPNKRPAPDAPSAPSKKKPRANLLRIETINKKSGRFGSNNAVLTNRLKDIQALNAKITNLGEEASKNLHLVNLNDSMVIPSYFIRADGTRMNITLRIENDTL